MAVEPENNWRFALKVRIPGWAHRGTGEMDVWLARNTEAIKSWLQRKK